MKNLLYVLMLWATTVVAQSHSSVTYINPVMGTVYSYSYTAPAQVVLPVYKSTLTAAPRYITDMPVRAVSPMLASYDSWGLEPKGDRLRYEHIVNGLLITTRTYTVLEVMDTPTAKIYTCSDQYNVVTSISFAKQEKVVKIVREGVESVYTYVRY